MTVVLCLALPLRMHRLWKRIRVVTIAFPCQSPDQARSLIGEGLKGLCQAEQVQADGSILFEPTPIRRRLGLKPASLTFPGRSRAVVTGQAGMLANLSRTQGLSFEEAPGASFGNYIKQKAKFFGWGLAVLFVVLFITLLIIDPDNLSRKGKSPSSKRSLHLIQDGAPRIFPHKRDGSLSVGVDMRVVLIVIHCCRPQLQMKAP